MFVDILESAVEEQQRYLKLLLKLLICSVTLHHYIYDMSQYVNVKVTLI